MATETFSPREVQARVRAGASAEVVSAETGWPLDKVLRYAEPLIAERAFIASAAQAVEVRRSGGGATLAESAEAVLGVAPEWDALRRDDGKWVVVANYRDRSGSATAHWTYDHAGHNLHPLDDAARSLMGVQPVGTDTADAIADALGLLDEPRAVEESRPRLVAVPNEPVDDDDVDLIDDLGVDVVVVEEIVVEEIVVQDFGRDELSVEDDLRDEAPDSMPAAVHSASRTPLDDVLFAVQEPIAHPTSQPRKPAKKKGRGRASVPTWDEILFGAKKPED